MRLIIFDRGPGKLFLQRAVPGRGRVWARRDLQAPGLPAAALGGSHRERPALDAKVVESHADPKATALVGVRRIRADQGGFEQRA